MGTAWREAEATPEHDRATQEVRAEQSHLDRAYARLEQVRADAAERAAAALATATEGGQISAKIDRDALVRTSLGRRASLQIGDQSLCFGRLDTTAAEVFHIGRLSVSDNDGEVLVVDWRAPVAEAFYRATSREPGDVVRRRHLRMQGRVVVGIDDELLDRRGADGSLELVGEAALLAALDAARTGRMGDIVATIQGEQDRAIRAPLAGVLVVQGGPGTGKTAVALHRAAYLLYAHSFPLASQGVLVVGPNPVFCRYVENVLPGLGETGVRLATPGQLVPGVAVTAVDSPAAAAIKGDGAMVDAMRAVMARHHPPLDETAVVGFGAWRLTLTPEQSAAVLDAAATEPTYNAGRLALRRGVLKEFARQARAARKRAVRARIVGPEAAPTDLRGLVDELRRTPAVVALLDRLWPALSPDDLVDGAITDAGLPTREARSEHDAALLDEASLLLGPARSRRAAAARSGRRTLDASLDRTLSEMGLLPSCDVCTVELRLEDGKWICDACFRRWEPRQVMSEVQRRRFDEIVDSVTQTHRAEPVDEKRGDTFGHAVIDEAQDLTPMQWRVIRRRCPSGSMTIVGDLGQVKNPWGARSWSAVAEVAAPDAPVELLELAVNYRTPEEIMEPAAAVLAAIHPGVRPPRSVRRSGVAPRTVSVDAEAELLDVARRTAAEELERHGAGTVAIVLPEQLSHPAGVDVLDLAVAEVGIEDVKGLEFDIVVLVEPAQFEPGALYVALTRATARLAIVHALPLPAALATVG